MTTKSIERSTNNANTKTNTAIKIKLAGQAKYSVSGKLPSTGIVPNQRAIMIAEAAYFRAERRGFDPVDQLKDWLEAEAEIDALLGKLKKGTSETVI